MKKSHVFQFIFHAIGVCCILWGLYQAYLIVSSGTVQSQGFAVTSFFSRIGYLPFVSLLIFSVIFASLMYIAIGIVFIGLGSLKANVGYWSIQAFLWLFAFTLWYRETVFTSGGVYNNLWPFYADPMKIIPWFIVTLLCSLLLQWLHTSFSSFFSRAFSLLKS